MIKSDVFRDIKSQAAASIISNEEGDYFMHSENFSKYQGYSFNEEMTVYKVIDSILIKDSKVIDSVFNPSFIEVIGDKGRQRFSISDNGLLYEKSSVHPSEVVLDARKLFDMSSFGRYYEIMKEDGIVIVKFSKKKDANEPDNEEYEIFLAIKADNPDIVEIKTFERSEYEFDKLRNDTCERYVYHALYSDAERIALSSSTKKDNAIIKVKKLYDESNFERNTPAFNVKSSKDINYAYNLSMNALSNLYKKNLKGIYAGMPWFMQFWTRDSAISSKAISKIDKNFTRNLLYNYVKSIREDGLIPNRLPHSDLNSIDSSGLVFFRIKENLELFNKEELKKIYEMLKKSIDSIMLNHFENFVVCKKYETWMDTDIRDGARIEIQALFLSMLSLARELSIMFSDPISTKLYLGYEKELLEKTVAGFFEDNILFDGLYDKTIRPNIFLTYYFYPKLLSDKEWEKVFARALDSLFLEWGGIATIDKNDSRFTLKHTGMNNNSYHNGDSWYFINAIAVICMRRVNKNKFKKYISKIVSASTEEILNKGIFGYHAEISSAEKLESNGCLAQTWSSAMYIEMIDELNK